MRRDVRRSGIALSTFTLKESPIMTSLCVNSLRARTAVATVILLLSGVVSASAQAVKTEPVRKPFQARIIVNTQSNGFQTVFMPIPAGKRLVIENISAIARTAPGQRVEMNYFTYMDNDGDGVGGIEDITFHRIPLIDQGTFGDTAIASANHKVLVFADELIGTAHYQVGVQARLGEYSTVMAHAQVTFSGYLEDLPTAK
jgi:hypothetical protein